MHRVASARIQRRLRITAIAGFLAALTMASACGDEGPPHGVGDQCATAFSLLSEMHAALQKDVPTCQSETDCIRVSYGVECLGSFVGGCGAVIHRTQLDQYEVAQTRVQAGFCAAAMKSEYGCSVSPQCAASRVACEAGRCTSLLNF
jgi:hypothetical protein